MALVDDLAGFWTFGPNGQAVFQKAAQSTASATPSTQGVSQQQAFDQWSADPTQWTQGLTPDLLNGVKNQGWITAPNANVSANDNSFGQFIVDKNTGEITYAPAGRGAGEAAYVYNPDGTFNRTRVNGKDPFLNPLFGVAAVAGAAFGMNALAAGVGGATAAAGTEAAPTLAAPVGSGYGASFGLSPSVFTTPTLAEGAGVGSAAGGGASLFANPATWTGAVPEGVGYGFTPGLPAVPGASAPRVPTPGSPGGPGGGPGGAPSAANTAAESLGGKVLDRLGGQLTSAVASSVLGTLMSPKNKTNVPSLDTPAPSTTALDSVTKALSVMPDPLAQQRAKKRSLIEQLGRRGRASTVLTNGGRLGA